jgi:glycosyltransferase involved in cell wall biosynthesis
MMAACEVTANNALIDANYYTQMGHPRSLYLQNMWPDASGGPVFGGRTATDGLVHVCGSVGNLAATGNTFGLHYLGAELMPRLKARLGGEQLAIDIFGGGKLRPSCAAVLAHPAIRLRGWVENIDVEITQAAAFLVLTNVYGFNVGNTRILLAWSLGACVIAHTSSRLSMPELEHGENALLGETADDLADMVVQAILDPGLRERIGRGGFETFCKYYRSDEVVPRMLIEIDRTVKDFKGGDQQC